MLWITFLCPIKESYAIVIIETNSKPPKCLYGIPRWYICRHLAIHDTLRIAKVIFAKHLNFNNIVTGFPKLLHMEITENIPYINQFGCSKQFPGEWFSAIFIFDVDFTGRLWRWLITSFWESINSSTSVACLPTASKQGAHVSQIADLWSGINHA